MTSDPFDAKGGGGFELKLTLLMAKADSWFPILLFVILLSSSLSPVCLCSIYCKNLHRYHIVHIVPVESDVVDAQYIVKTLPEAQRTQGIEFKT